MSKLFFFGFLLVIGTVWGATIPLTKLAVSTGHGPLGLIFWQMLISALVLGAIALVRRTSLGVTRQHLIFYAVIALIGTIIPNGFSYFSAFYLPGGVMALTIAAVPLFALPIALIFGLERPDLVRLVGVLLGMVAISLLVLPETGLPDPSLAIFVLIALIAPFCYGVEACYLSLAVPAGTGALHTLLGASVIGTGLSLPLAVATGQFVDPLAGLGTAEYSLVASTIMHVVAYGGYIWLVEKAGSVFASQVAYIVTPAGVILSMLALGETHSGWLWASLALMLLALAMVQPRKAGAETVAD